MHLITQCSLEATSANVTTAHKMAFGAPGFPGAPALRYAHRLTDSYSTVGSTFPVITLVDFCLGLDTTSDTKRSR